MNLETWITKQEAFAEKATEGPWHSDEKWFEKTNKRGPSSTIGSCDGYGREKNAAFIASSRTSLPLALKMLRTALGALEDIRFKSGMDRMKILGTAQEALTEIQSMIQP